MPTASTYLERLNPEQRRAVEHGATGEGMVAPLLVIAGAGSGKTNTLAHRVAHLIVNGADPRRIRLMTFSRRAASEMTKRIERIARNVMGDNAGVSRRVAKAKLYPSLALDIIAFTSMYHPLRCYMDGEIMPENIHELRPRPADTEKITINLGYVDLGHVDLMVQEGFYSNRTDFIRTAIRNQLERHADVGKQSTARKSLDLGLRNYSREDLEAARKAGEMLHINVLGLASIAQDVTPELARATIASVSVLGALHASSAVKAALADRMR